MKNGTVTIVLNVVLFLIGIPCINLEDVNTVLNPTSSLVQNESIRDYQESDKVDEKLANIEPVLEPILEPSVNVEESVKVAIDSESLEGQKGPNTENDKSEVPNRVIDDTPILLSTESSTVELDQLSDISVVLTSQNEEIASKKILETENVNIPINISANTSAESEEKKVEETVIQSEEGEKNATEGKTEDIPSFSEWAQKRLEEVEKNEQINSSMKGNQVPNGKTQNAKLRWKNYASLDCGAKVVAANPEANSPGAILSPSSDEYKLNPCTSRIWFVVELCEAIQAKKIDLANYELFSSSPKEFTVSVSERFPTRDWAQIGKFTAKDERDIQSFDLDTELFGKYIKVEIKSHYGSEHYCPISLFRAYGASVFEVLQKEDSSVNRPDDDDEDEDDEENDLNSSQTDKKNLFSSATDAVMSVVKRAAQILGTKSNDDSQKTNSSSASTLINTCSSPRHIISCQKCNETLYGQIYELLSCKAEEIRRIVSINSIYKTLVSSCICKKFGYDFKNQSDRNYLIKNIEAFFPESYIGAMCNEAAILENYGVLNVSQQFNNITKKISNEKLIEMNIEIQEVRVVESVTSSDILQNNTITNVSTDEIAQIKPTKTLTVNETLPKTDTQGTPSESVASVETVTELPETAIFPESTTEGTFVSEGDVSTEGTDVLDDQLNNIISDLTAEGPTVVPSSASANSPQAAKESIFLRLFNRIKALERNMSLSSQYLEELSKRYKKQVEEMREETQKRDELNKQLEERLDKLTSTIENMAAERRTFLSVAYCLLFLGLSCLGIYFFCGKRTEVSRDREEMPSAGRRKSVDDMKKKEEKKRRPSDQVLKIVRYSSLNEDRKPKKKKKKIYHNRSISLGSIKLDKEKWPEEGEGRSMIEEVPVVLDESDNSILDGCKLSKEVEIEGQSKSSQTEIECRNEENNLSTYANLISNEPIKKEKKGLKRLLKKVF
uniref:SUN domain-containing ossification factor n=1 Tax=Diabrotica virgifera virgifera TaxID=50390 RepID=A0A6P7FB98_DIAVI